MTARTVRIRPDAPHVPRRYLGRTAEVVERKRLSFGTVWLRVRFPGVELWVPAERVEETGAGAGG